MKNKYFVEDKYLLNREVLEKDFVILYLSPMFVPSLKNKVIEVEVIGEIFKHFSNKYVTTKSFKTIQYVYCSTYYKGDLFTQEEREYFSKNIITCGEHIYEYSKLVDIKYIRDEVLKHLKENDFRRILKIKNEVDFKMLVTKVIKLKNIHINGSILWMCREYLPWSEVEKNYKLTQKLQKWKNTKGEK